MERNKHWYLALLLSLLFLRCDDKKSSEETIQESVFERVPSTHSGVSFSNGIRADVSSKANVFDFDFFYNGSGVGISDLNNDGLQDLVFLANQGENKIYINEGDLKFQNITAQSGINHSKEWATGVTFVDINNDGWQDIYISQGGPYDRSRRKNLLFVNQQDLTFAEEAEEYGLADTSISSQSAFFDYDQDGDLDCIVMNESTLYGLDPRSFFSVLNSDEDLLYQSSSHLYENREGKFVDVTKETGLLSPTFGLGLMISDINADGWLDIYIANDYYVPDCIYLNKGDGTFSNEVKTLTNQVSFFGMGVDIADINNDGHRDVFVLDMASSDHYRAKTLMASMNVKAFDLLVNELDLHYQYMFNSFQLNQGNGKFQNIAQLANLSKTDWSWAALIADFNNNGDKDIYVTNGYKKYALDNDIRTRVLEAKRAYNGNVPINIKEDIYDEMPSEKLSNVMFQNEGQLKFKDVTKKWGLERPSFSNGAAYADLDDDGDLDLVVNNMDDEAFIYRNLSTDNGLGNYLKIQTVGFNKPSFAKVTIHIGDDIQHIECSAVKGYLSSMDDIAHFGIGTIEKVDKVAVEWMSGRYEEKYNVLPNQVITFKEENAQNRSLQESDGTVSLFQYIPPTLVGLDFEHQENIFDDFELESLLPYKQSTLGPFLSKSDVNGDGLEDLHIGGPLGQSGELYIQQVDGTFVQSTPAVMRADAVFEDIASIFLDVDNDGDQDLYVVSGGYEFMNEADEYRDRLYVNDGAGNYARSIDQTLRDIKLSGKSVVALDFNGDGLKDLVIGNRVIPGKYPMAPSSKMYQNTGNAFVDVTAAIIPALGDFGMINEVITTDFNGDGLVDIIAVGEWTQIGLFQNQKGTFVDVSPKSDLDDLLGWWFTIKETDVNLDGFPDYVVGNLGLNSKYKASKGSPLKIYAADFDETGSWDVVFSNKYKGKYVPFRGRECSSNQMPFIKTQLPTYDMFAKATIEDVYGDKLHTSFQKEANEFRSMLLINNRDGSFETRPLPIEAQMAPILDIESLDVNNDGYEDLIVIGNIYNTEVETPRLDAGAGLVLLADTNGFYKALDSNQSDLYVEGNAKSVTKINIGGVDHLIFGINNDALALFKFSQSNQ